MEKEKIKKLLSHNKREGIKDLPELRKAGVLLPLFQKNTEIHILLTKRTDRVEHHKGQICFPGGTFDDADRDCLSTALRETEEEIGLERNSIEILGELDPVVTLSKYHVFPYVGFIPYPYPFKLCPFEVDRLIELPLGHLNGNNGLKETPFSFQGQSLNALNLDYQGDIVWGATARILQNFLEIFTRP
jgi:8-oxo-dGTP pyrophosphatase MutT (NUDIX family)